MNYHPDPRGAQQFANNMQAPPPPTVIHSQPVQQQYRPMATPVPSMVEVVNPRVKPEKVQAYFHGYSFYKSEPYTKTGGWDSMNRGKMKDNQETLKRLVAESSQDTLSSLRKEKQVLITSLLAKKSRSEKNPDAEWVIAGIKLAHIKKSVTWAINGKTNHKIDVVLQRRPRSNKKAKKSSKYEDTTDAKAKSKKSKKGGRKQSDESDSASVSDEDELFEENPPIEVNPLPQPVNHGPPPPPPINTQMPFRPGMSMPPNNPNINVPNVQGVNAPHPMHPNIQIPTTNNPFLSRVPFQSNGSAQPAGMGPQGRGGPNMAQRPAWPPPIVRNPAPFQRPPPAYATAPPPYVPRPEQLRPPQPSARRTVDEWQDRPSSYTDSEDPFWSNPNSPRVTTPATSPSRGRSGYYRDLSNGDRVWIEPGRNDTRGRRSSDSPAGERFHRLDKERRDRAERDRRRSIFEREERDRERRDRDDRSLDRHRQRSRECRYTESRFYGNPSDAGRSRFSDGSSRDDAIFADEERRIRERDVEERIRGAYRKGLDRGRDI